MPYQSTKRSQPSSQRLWQDFKTRATVKTAQEPTFIDPAAENLRSNAYYVQRQQPDVVSQNRRDSVKLMLASLLGGAAIGGTVTGISGLRNLMKKPKPPTEPQELDMPLPHPMNKVGQELPPVHVGGKDWATGQGGKHVGDLWWTIPGVLAGAGAGTFGASKLMQHLIKRKRKSMINQDMQAAQQNFQNSMLDQYKQSSADPLDNIYDNIEKRGSLFNTGGLPVSAGSPATGVEMREWAPAIAGTGISAAAILGALATRGAWKTQEGRTQEDLLQKALKQKSYLHSLRSPMPVSFTPQAVETNENQQ